MKVVAYLYSKPLLESMPNPNDWGWEVQRIYQDFAIEPPPEKSKNRQSKPVTNRPQWQQLIEDSQIEPLDCLLIRRLEDLGDSMQEVSDRLAELESLNIQLVAIEQASQFSQLNTHVSVIQGIDLRADLLKLLQQIQQSQRSQRIREGHARNRVKALPPPGKAPYGYKRGRTGYVVDRTTAPVVKDFFEQFLLYGSLRGAVRYLNKKYSKKISVSTGHRWLTNPVYRGNLEYQDGQTVLDTHPAIIARDEAAQVDRLLRRNRRLPPRTASASRSLAGLVACQQCQSLMTVARVSTRNKQREYLYLRPTHCPLKPKCQAIAYEQVLQQTIDRICQDLPQAVAGVTMPDMDQVKQGIESAIAVKQAILAQLPELLANGVLDSETANLREYKLRTEIAALQKQVTQLPPVNLKSIAQAISLPQFWLDLSEAERRFYFREFIRQIQLIRQDGNWSIKLLFIF
jgi:DNA invertase Pin-like site-specific DNA recombinase